MIPEIVVDEIGWEKLSRDIRNHLDADFATVTVENGVLVVNGREERYLSQDEITEALVCLGLDW